MSRGIARKRKMCLDAGENTNKCLGFLYLDLIPKEGQLRIKTTDQFGGTENKNFVLVSA